MVKKRRQGDPNVDDSNSSSDENFRTSSEKSGESALKCSHVKKAIDQTKLRRKYKQTAIDMEKCTECNKTTVNGGDAAEKNEDDYEVDITMWMCLKCGTHLCGRTVNKHALKHYEVLLIDLIFVSINKHYLFLCFALIKCEMSLFTGSTIRFTCTCLEHNNVNNFPRLIYAYYNHHFLQIKTNS